MIDRRKFFFGAASLFAGPAIIRSGILMPVKTVEMTPRLISLSGMMAFGEGFRIGDKVYGMGLPNDTFIVAQITGDIFVIGTLAPPHPRALS